MSAGVPLSRFTVAAPAFYGDDGESLTIGGPFPGLGVDSLLLIATGPEGEEAEWVTTTYLRLPRSAIRELRDEFTAWLDRTGS